MYNYRMEEKEELIKKIEVLENQVHELEKDLIHDSLTSLKTRAFFEEETGIYISAIANLDAGKRRQWFGFKNISFLFFDIDHFKKINDTYGHAMGDQILREVAGEILRSVRGGDTVARWGGEEMVASILGANELDAKNKAEEIRKNIESMNFLSAPDLKVTISVGVASNEKGDTCSSLVEKADKAVYKAKESGRNKVVTYSEI